MRPPRRPDHQGLWLVLFIGLLSSLLLIAAIIDATSGPTKKSGCGEALGKYQADRRAARPDAGNKPKKRVGCKEDLCSFATEFRRPSDTPSSSPRTKAGSPKKKKKQEPRVPSKNQRTIPKRRNLPRNRHKPRVPKSRYPKHRYDPQIPYRRHPKAKERSAGGKKDMLDTYYTSNKNTIATGVVYGIVMTLNIFVLSLEVLAILQSLGWLFVPFLVYLYSGSFLTAFQWSSIQEIDDLFMSSVNPCLANCIAGPGIWEFLYPPIGGSWNTLPGRGFGRYGMGFGPYDGRAPYPGFGPGGFGQYGGNYGFFGGLLGGLMSGGRGPFGGPGSCGPFGGPGPCGPYGGPGQCGPYGAGRMPGQGLLGGGVGRGLFGDPSGVPGVSCRSRPLANTGRYGDPRAAEFISHNLVASPPNLLYPSVPNNFVGGQGPFAVNNNCYLPPQGAPNAPFVRDGGSDPIIYRNPFGPPTLYYPPSSQSNPTANQSLSRMNDPSPSSGQGDANLITQLFNYIRWRCTPIPPPRRRRPLSPANQNEDDDNLPPLQNPYYDPCPQIRFASPRQPRPRRPGTPPPGFIDTRRNNTEIYELV